MADEKWLRVLKKIYADDNYWRMDESGLEKISDDLGLSKDDIDVALDNLQAQGLIKRDIDEIKLTQRGFDLINRKKDHEEKLITDRLLLIFTTVLTLGVTVITAETLLNYENLVVTLSYYTIFAILFLVIGIIGGQKYKL